MKQNKNQTTAENTQQKDDSVKTNKILYIIAAVVLAVAFIVGGVVFAKQYHDIKASYTFEDGTPVPDSPQGIADGHGEKAQVVTGEDATAKAEVKDNDAIEKIKTFSAEQLGLSDKDYKLYTDNKEQAHSLMVAQQSYIIKGEAYVQVIAAIKKENKDGTLSITPVMKYYISFDGETILKEDPKEAGNYQELT